MAYAANVEPFYGNHLETLPDVRFIDSGSVNPDGEGKTWATAFHTFQAAINKVRYDSVTGTFDYTEKDRYYVLLAKPGHYDLTTYISFSGYNISIIGCGPVVPGKDYGVSINYSGAVAATAIMAGSGAGLCLKNLHIGVGAYAIPGIIMMGDNNLIENCVIDGDGATATHGIYLYGLKGGRVRNNVISNFITTGIGMVGGANTYFIHADISGNQIYAPAAAGAKGIYIPGSGTLVAYNAVIKDNFVDVYNGGATAKGIDVDHNGRIFVQNNCVVTAASAVGIEHAGLGVMCNNVSVNGTPGGDSSHSFVDDGTKA